MRCPHPSVLRCSFVLCILDTCSISLSFSYYISSLVTYQVPIRLPLELTEAKGNLFNCLFVFKFVGSRPTFIPTISNLVSVKMISLPHRQILSYTIREEFEAQATLQR